MKFFTLLFLSSLLTFVSSAQLLSWSPEFIKESSTPIEITCDATLGNLGIKDYTPTNGIYVHIGAITTLSTSSSDWKYAPFTWATSNPSANAVYLGANKWKFTITGGLRTFFNMTNPSEKIIRIAILFRTATGSQVLRNADGGDMYIPVYDTDLYTRIDNPLRKPTYILGTETITKNVNDNVAITAKASASSTMKLYFNGTLLSTTAGVTTVSANPQITATGSQIIVAEANNGVTTAYDTVRFYVAAPVTIAPLPPGVTEGINYESDPTVATLVLYAPNKTNITVIGDFNNWTELSNYQMNKTADGKYFWIKLTGLTSGVEYAYQYVIDGALKVADYNTEKVLDPWNDQYITATTYPNLKAYPVNKTSGIVSILQTNKPTFNWQYPFTRPNKKNLVIYEMLLRDFLTNHDFKTLKDSINYLAKLGVNTIELMPITEFEGNESWGYNPAYFFAPDKYYGPENTLRLFIDECHKNGIAVVLDMVMNHAFGSCPMVQMYWDAATSKPSATSPWFNPDAKHPFNVGYDFNHESQATKDFVDRVMTHWLTKYKVDGFRWDLSKGFTQTNSGSDVNLWSNYDGSRIAIWKRIYDKMQTISPNSYCILEHFANNSEETELSNYGMLLWGNANYQFNQASMGYSADSDFGNSLSTSRGWSNAHLVGYAESHDEERLNFKNINYGNVNGGYNIKDTNTAIKRQELVAAFVGGMPGPKMIWQMGELGYDYSINYCTNGTINTNCRLDNKPVKWNYFQNANRKNLYNVYSKIFALRNFPTYSSAFTVNSVTASLSPSIKQIHFGDANLKVVIVGNFGVSATGTSVTFPNTGTWYDYLNNTTLNVTSTSQGMFLAAGDYYIFTDKNANAVILNSGNSPTPIAPARITHLQLTVGPNPIKSNAIINYDLPVSGVVNLKMMDINGKVISNLFSGFKSKGKQQYQLNTSNLEMGRVLNGLYLIQLEINGNKQTSKVIVAN
jgi:hypothetical protein